MSAPKYLVRGEGRGIWEFNDDAAVDEFLRGKNPDHYHRYIVCSRRQVERIMELAAGKPPRVVKPRWPVGTPENVLQACRDYWAGTTELRTFRVHCWNEVAVVTSYPGQMYQSGQVRNYGPACFSLISLIEKERGHTGNLVGAVLRSWPGRVSKKELQSALDAYLKSA